MRASGNADEPEKVDDFGVNDDPLGAEDRVDDVGDLAQPADASPQVGLRKSSTVARGDRAGLRSALRSDGIAERCLLSAHLARCYAVR
jgi:hypothetical protein